MLARRRFLIRVRQPESREQGAAERTDVDGAHRTDPPLPWLPAFSRAQPPPRAQDRAGGRDEDYRARDRRDVGATLSLTGTTSNRRWPRRRRMSPARGREARRRSWPSQRAGV